MFSEVLQRFHRLDILVNNAGVQTWKTLLELEEHEWDRVIDTNLKGCFLCTQRAARQMKDSGRRIDHQYRFGLQQTPISEPGGLHGQQRRDRDVHQGGSAWNSGLTGFG